MAQQEQIHLASKVTIPAQVKDGKEVVAARELRIVGMSGRCVRIEQLDALKIQQLEADAAKMAGADASFGELRNLQRMYALYEMVKAYSDGTDEPGKLNPEKGWHTATFTDFVNPLSASYWPKIFTPKDTAFLKQEFITRHEMNQMEFDLLSGKSIPVATEG